MDRGSCRAFALSAIVAVVLSAAASAADKSAAAEHFEKKVRPILVEHCHKCHADKKAESGLRLDSRDAMLQGGDSGPAIVPGNAEESLLVDAIRYGDTFQMPPDGKLKQEQIDILVQWVQDGAEWPESKSLPAEFVPVDRGKINPQARQFWSLQPVKEVAPPAVQNVAWPKRAIDRFILAKLEEQGLSPARRAEPRVLLRRLTFDLIGLPPTPEEVAEFEAASRLDPQAALEAAVDRLLASPHYGERQARWWLDIARYGEDQAHTFEARKYPQGFRYRDWLVEAFNGDLPYDQFVKQQIAADLLNDSDDPQRLAALGFFACGPVYYGDRNQMDQIADRIDTLSRGFLGLTMACARCHDHKFDPISTVDYYALAGVFASTEYVEVPLVSAEEVEAANKTLTEQEKKQKSPPKKYPFVHALKDKSEPVNLRVHLRGNANNLGDEAPRRFMEVLCEVEPAPFKQGSGRLELAQAIASPDNPLTARVLVNRIWQQHFGRGLVRTSSNFGHLGERPSHPELLDYLALKFVEGGWSIKRLHREMVLSATYQQSSETGEAKQQADPENLLLSRMSRRRLEVEAWRDAMLAASGQLDAAIGGPSLDLASAENRRRTLYGRISRHELDQLLRLFDFPDPNITSDQRTVTTVPLQQLFVLNSDFMVNNAKALAARLQSADVPDEAARIRLAYELLYARPAGEEEIQLGLRFLSGANFSAGQTDDSKLSRWERYAQALLATNEFLYVD